MVYNSINLGTRIFFIVIVLKTHVETSIKKYRYVQYRRVIQDKEGKLKKRGESYDNSYKASTTITTWR
jgi:hypothetical protein